MAILLVVILFSFCTAMAQPPSGIHWSKNGNGYYTYANGEISYNNLLDNSKLVVINKKQLTPVGSDIPLSVRNFFFSND